MGIFASYQTGGSQTFLNGIINKLPYSYNVLQNLEQLNPKYGTFHGLTARKDELIAKQSIFQQQPDDGGAGQIMVNKDYSRYMYAQLDLDKTNRVRDYRSMAIFAEVSDCIDEICDEAIVKDENDKTVQFTLRGKHDSVIKEEINKEFNQFINIFDLESRGWEQFRNFLIDGELFFENITVKGKENLGILGLVSIPTELINPIYDNVQNSIIQGYLLRKPNLERKGSAVLNKEEKIIPLDKNQVTYINSGIWNEDKTVRLPYIEACRRAFKQLSLIEDSIVIYRLVRAPERLVFKIDVGNMPPPKAEAYVKRLMQQYWNKKGYDSATGRITNQYDPQSMLDSYWFAKRTGTEGTTVETLPGGQNLGQLEDLNYFVGKLYKSLKVPISRLQPDDAFRDGTEITREELRFARFVMRIQRQFAMGVRDTFISHLKLRGLWKEYKLREHQINVKFNTPTSFMAMRDQQLFELKQNNFNNMSQNEGIANSYAQRHYLGLSDPQMAENREWLKKDAALQWEIDQIRSMGPDFRDQAQATDQAINSITGGGGGGTSAPPAFGPGPTGAGENPEGETGAGIPGAPGAQPTGAQAAPQGGAPNSNLPGAPPTR